MGQCEVLVVACLIKVVAASQRSRKRLTQVCGRDSGENKLSRIHALLEIALSSTQLQLREREWKRSMPATDSTSLLKLVPQPSTPGDPSQRVLLNSHCPSLSDQMDRLSLDFLRLAKVLRRKREEWFNTAAAEEGRVLNQLASCLNTSAALSSMVLNFMQHPPAALEAVKPARGAILLLSFSLLTASLHTGPNLISTNFNPHSHLTIMPNNVRIHLG